MDPEDDIFGNPILRPDRYCHGVAPARSMLNSDLSLHRKFTPDRWTPGVPWQPTAAPMYPFGDTEIGEADIAALQDYLQSIDANQVVPPASPPAEEEEKPEEEAAAPEAAQNTPFYEWEVSGPSRGTEDVGVSNEVRRGVREYLASGYTRRNPDGTHEVDNDFAGKWDDEISIVEVSGEHEFFDVAVAEGSVSNSFGEASGSILSANSNTQAGFEVTNQGFNATASAELSGAMAQGSIESVDTGLVAGGLEGSAVSGELVAEGKAEVDLEAGEATLGFELGANVNLVEGGGHGEIYITPRRVVGLGVSAVNWATGSDYEGLSENWDIGLVVGGDVDGRVGAGLGAEGELAYRNGKATAELGVSAALGLGGDVKVSGGFVGVDKVWNGITSAWNSIWD